jgi:UPF0271 protein
MHINNAGMESTVKLNCDLGEGFDEVDRKVMPLIDQANIACGGHAGDLASIARTVELAVKRDVAIGAHPSYPDKDNFGRKSLSMSEDALLESLIEQVGRIDLASRDAGERMAYIKAHGALYNDSAKNPSTMRTLLKLAKSFQTKLMVQALPNQSSLDTEAGELGVVLIKEGFADRAYSNEGFLLSRALPGAVHTDLDDIVRQAKQLADKEPIMSIDQKPLAISVDSICVHGDTDKAIEALRAIYNQLH